jgi:hypothetical protein
MNCAFLSKWFYRWSIKFRITRFQGIAHFLEFQTAREDNVSETLKVKGRRQLLLGR